MSKFETAIETYTKQLETIISSDDINHDLIHTIAKSLGPSIYKSDSSKVACSKKSERENIKNNFLVKKLKLKKDPSLDSVILDVCKTMGSSNRNKYRVVFYYLLTTHFNKENVFIPEVNSSKGTDTKIDKQTSVANKTSKNKKDTSIKNDKPFKEDDNTEKDKKDTSPIPVFIYDTTPEKIIKNYSIYAAGAGLVPVPIVDAATISMVQYQMIKKLSTCFDHVKFDEKKAKAAKSAILKGISSFEIGWLSKIIFRRLPIIGLTTVSAYAYASTKVIGQLFYDHFKTGNDLDINEVTLQKMKLVFKKSMK